MTPSFSQILISLVTLTISSAVAEISDWPGYLGPNKNSISPDPTLLADTWPAEGPPELWSIEVQPGHGGPAVVDGKIYLMDRVDGEKDVLKVIDFKTGKLLQEAEVASEGRVNFPGSRGVPTVTDKYVFATGPMGIVAAWKRDELSLLWSTDLVKEFGAEPLHFGYPVEVKWPPTRYWERPSDSGLAFSSPSDFDSRGIAGWSAPPGSDL